LLSPAPVLASEPGQDPDAVPRSIAEVAPVASGVAPGRKNRPGHHLHDGFFLRLSQGVGMLRNTRTTTSNNSALGTSGASSASRDYFGFAGEVSVGAAVIPGFILAGTISNQVGGDDDGSVAAIGAMADVYFAPRGGFHVGGLFGLGLTDVTRTQGIAMGAHVGYEAWLSSDWAIGAMFRFLYAPFRPGCFGDCSGTVSTTFAKTIVVPQLLFTATFN
jgi:hypothetical protein